MTYLEIIIHLATASDHLAAIVNDQDTSHLLNYEDEVKLSLAMYTCLNMKQDLRRWCATKARLTESDEYQAAA